MESKKLYKIRITLVAGFLLISGFSFLLSPITLYNEIAADNGDIEKQLELGRHYLDNRYSTHYKCTSGNFTSFICRTIFGDSDIDTVERGIYWLQKASNNGSDQATYLLALALQGEFDPTPYKKEKVPGQLDEARALLISLADAGYIEASYKLGWYYLRGVGGDIDLDLAIKYLTIAHNNGHPKAQRLLDIAISEKQANNALNLTNKYAASFHYAAHLWSS